MRTTIKSFFVILAIFLTSCGENTTTVIPDIASIKIDDGDISLYSTDAPRQLTASVTYTDNTSAQIEDKDIWANSDYSILGMYYGEIYANNNSGSSTISISSGRFDDDINVSIISLVDFNITNENITSTGEHILEATGVFEDANSKIIAKNITWNADNDANISIDENYIATITIFSGDTNVSATVFEDDSDTNITKSIIYSIN